MPSKSTVRPSEIPDEFFVACAFLLPYLNKVAQDECKISVGSIFVMMHLAISGRLVDGRRTMLQSDLTKLLHHRGFSQAGASRLLKELDEAGFVERTFLSTDVRQEVFEPSERVNTQAVILLREGEEKIAEFKAALRAHFGHWLSSELRKSNKPDWLAKWVRKLLISDIAIKLARSFAERMATVETAGN